MVSISDEEVQNAFASAASNTFVPRVELTVRSTKRTSSRGPRSPVNDDETVGQIKYNPETQYLAASSRNYLDEIAV